MQLRIACLADQANVSMEGKLNITGIFNQITAHKFPTLHPLLVLVLQFALEHEDSGRQHTVKVVFMDEDGKTIAKMAAEVQVPEVSAGSKNLFQHIVAFAGVRFQKAGTYCFDITLEGKPAFRLDLVLKAIQ